MSVQALRNGTGRVDAEVTATARFELPSDQDVFLKMARLYRSPENRLRTELIPAFEETLGATAALMSAEDYFQGGKTKFNNEFQRLWANAYAKRNVPQYVIGTSDSDTPTGSDRETQLLEQLLSMEYAKRLDYDRTLLGGAPETAQ